jgi:uncharacterized protein YdhG (YjbR/CyaY superfamily)
VTSGRKKTPRTIDDLLAGLSDDKRRALETLRRTIRATIPDAEECISYGVPSFRIGGRYFLSFGAGAGHCAFYPGAEAIARHRAELAAYDTSKGTVRFAPKRGLPVTLVRKLVRARIDAMGGAKPRKPR